MSDAEQLIHYLDVLVKVLPVSVRDAWLISCNRIKITHRLPFRFWKYPDGNDVMTKSG